MRHIVLITTGGTIEKTYNEDTGLLANTGSIVRRMLQRLRLEDTSLSIVELMSKDSLLMNDDDRARISAQVSIALAADPAPRGVIILHGTDTLAQTGRRLHADLASNPASPLRAPVVLTGAMRPFEMTRSDSLQNLTESLFATAVLPPGVFCVAHGRALPFPSVRKDRDRRTFVAGD
jgi:L-asparaginase